MLFYVSRTDGIGGTIKNAPEDFIVEEILPDGTVLELNGKIERENVEDKFVHFILQKKDWNTNDAIKAIARQLHISFTRFNFAGTKDKIAISTQLVSCFGIEKEKIENTRIRDIQVNGTWYANEKIKLGNLLGNRFTIKVDNTGEKAEAVIKKIYEELKGRIPNYFGEQRFGTTRKNTHIIGEKLIRNRLKDAMMTFLCDSEGETHEQAKLARKELLTTNDFEAALRNFPKHLRIERSAVAHLTESENDFAGAFRKLPRNILLLFVHAFQSHLFNTMLSERIAHMELKPEQGEYFCETDFYGFPDLEKKGNKGFLAGKLIGYETGLNERETALLEKFGIKKEDFRIRSLPEISSRGTYRTLFAPLRDFSFSGNTFRFSLQSGSYATVAMREFLDEK